MRISYLMIVTLFISISTLSATLRPNSYRIQSMGNNLAWIVDDPYTDIMHNPAELNTITKIWLFTNLSGLGNEKHMIFDNGGNFYQGVYAPALLGMFYPLGNWKLAVIGQYIDVFDKTTASYVMPGNLSSQYQFDWYTDSGNSGTSIKIMDNGTDNPNDDYRITDEISGTKLNDQYNYSDFDVLLARQRWGIRYNMTIRDKVNGDPQLNNVSHTYRITEIGSQSAKESVWAEQLENSENSQTSISHSLHLGIQGNMNDKVRWDLLGKLMVKTNKLNESDKREKNIDYDPDSDGIPYNEYPMWYPDYLMYDYQYESSSIRRETITTALATGRLIRDVNSDNHLVIYGTFGVFKTTDDKYYEHGMSSELLTTQTSTEIDEYSDWEITGSITSKGLKGTLAIGNYRIIGEKLYLGYGAIAKGVSSTTSNSYSGSDNYSQTLENVDFTLELPVGMEYEINQKIRLRLGVNNQFYFNSYSRDDERTVISSDGIWNNNLIFQRDLRTNYTKYSYGLAINPSQSFQIDIMGITNLTEISDFYISIIFRY